MENLNIERLTWYPWIGDKYRTSNSKILIVGESHYVNDAQVNENCSEEKDYTQRCIQEAGIDRVWKNQSENTYANMKKVIGDTADIGDIDARSKFWHTVSFYNFIQYPMPNKTTRPNQEQVNEAILVFIELIKNIEPNEIIFIGTSSIGYVNNGMKECQSADIKVNKFEPFDKINGAIPARLVVEINTKEIPIYFIKHTAKYFSPDVWRSWLKDKRNNFQHNL